MQTKTTQKTVVTLNELVNIFMNFKMVAGMPTFAKVVQVCDARANKKCRISKELHNFGTIYKVSQVSILLNGEYVKAVTNQLKREDKPTELYKAGKNTMPLVMGENNCFIGFFNDEPVLQYRPNPNESIRPRTKYIYSQDGQMRFIDKSKIDSILPVVHHAENQGTDKEILWRKLYMKNILEITFNGTTYRVKRS